MPFGLSTAKLRQPHSSIPANPLLAEPMYLAGYIERLGTGTGDIIRLCKEKGLKEPDFIQEEDFKTIIWRTFNATWEVTGEATGEATGEVVEAVKRIVVVLNGEMKRIEIQEALGLKHQENFRDNYLLPSLESGYLEMTIPETPTHQEQRYRLTAKGIKLKKKLKKSKKKK